MDLIKIGTYIAGKRKELGMTQRQIAEKLDMSDKSVSKWERGVCLPDVSVYSELCLILGISLNEFLAGEDIAQESVIQKSEENIIGVATDSKHKQKRLKAMICILLVISVLAVSVIGVTAYRANRPQNIIAPIDQNSIEMETVELLAGPDGAHIFKFTTTDNYNRLNLYSSEYQSGKLVNKETFGLGFGGMESPENGEILIIPDFENFIIKVIISADGAKCSTELPILADDLQQKRENLLKKISPVAPEWADAISSRSGIHGEYTVPSTIEDAWKWKQYSGIIADITSEPFDALQEKSLRLSKEYRRLTAICAEKKAWYALLSETERDIDMKQALQGWKLTVQKIGKGTGKNAPMYKAKARKLMAKCQKAVPAWIMPISKALESLDPRTNRFDIIIIDEASQSDITALAIAYMADKLIIVGDDKQVSPMAVGVEVDKMNSLIQMYIKDKIPNSHLYNAKTSLYEIALTTYQPLMLREHFRCVPEIIGFSNALSYDYKIKPLRDASDCAIFPSVVNYRVTDGKRTNKENAAEAKTIVSLMQACIEQPEYKQKTFGIISLLGDEQAKKIQSLILERIDAKDIEKRRILCGNASNFQGDERDIVFLSLVDSNDEQGPLKKMEFGVDDANRKRYNVAVSRAKDQLWVVDSLDAANDLKPGDIRKRLIDYSLNPSAYANLAQDIDEKAESPFESAVAKVLTGHGYHLVQQWKVGAYRLDIVAVCGNKKVAIECDGERYHDGETKIREDMERQTILERLGWHFIRIRGSEYYRNPGKTAERVFAELSSYGIEPEELASTSERGRTSDLLERIKIRALEILSSFDVDDHDHIDTMVAVLESVSGKEKPSIADTKPTQPLTEKVSAAALSVQPPKQEQHQKIPVQNSAHMQSNRSKAWKNDKKAEDNPIAKKPSYGSPKPRSGNNGDSVVAALNRGGYKHIDNRTQSGIIWVLYVQEQKAEIESLLSDCNCVFHLEKRGSIATGGQPAWLVKLM